MLNKYGKKNIISKNRRVKKDTKMIRVYEDPKIGDTIDGEVVIKVVNHYGKRYAVVKRNENLKK